MYVCNCAGVTRKELSCHLQQGIAGLKALQAERGLCRGCGKCTREVRAVLKHCGYTPQNPLPSCLDLSPPYAS